jgi:hypothetical protein
MESQPLPIHDLASRHPGLTRALAESYLEAARVCLDRHHISPTEFSLKEESWSVTARVEWRPADDRCLAAYANEIDTTEFGAYLMALASLELWKGLVAVSRAETRTGADYYLSAAGQPAEDVEASFRLEASGTDRGDQPAIVRRLREKVDQTNKGQSNLPAIAVVVGFQARLVMIEQVGVP